MPFPKYLRRIRPCADPRRPHRRAAARPHHRGTWTALRRPRQHLRGNTPRHQTLQTYFWASKWSRAAARRPTELDRTSGVKEEQTTTTTTNAGARRADPPPVPPRFQHLRAQTVTHTSDHVSHTHPTGTPTSATCRPCERHSEETLCPSARSRRSRSVRRAM